VQKEEMVSDSIPCFLPGALSVRPAGGRACLARLQHRRGDLRALTTTDYLHLKEADFTRLVPNIAGLLAATVVFVTASDDNDGVPGAERRPDTGGLRRGRARQGLLEVLQGSCRPLDAAEAGRVVSLHRNTARAHLEALVSVGLARRTIEQRTTRGRPRVLYENAAGPTDLGRGSPVGPDSAYKSLAQSLAGQLSEMEDASSEAVRAGRRWAAAVDASPLSPVCPTPTEAVASITSLFDGLGFEPEARWEEGRILLHHCPFLEVAKDARPVVCGMHLGMLKATLERLNAPLLVTGFDPLVRDDPVLCVVNLVEDKSRLTRQANKPGATAP